MKRALLSTLILASSASLADGGLSRPDSHAPIGVMGDHTHAKGEWMFSYRYMDMEMEGNRTGTNRVSVDEVLNDFLVSPVDMDMRMHMLGAMHAPTDNLTLMIMVPFVELKMNHRSRAGFVTMMNARPSFETESSGVGDVKLGGLYNLIKEDGNNLIANMTLSIPTGSIDEQDLLAVGNSEMQLPYPMQLGSGTYDIMPGLTFTQLRDQFSWGAQGKATIRLGSNDNDYTLGNRYMLSSWIAKPVNDHISLSLRAVHDSWDDIDGADSALNPMLINGNGGNGIIPTVRTDLRGGSRTDVGVGANFIFAGKGVSNHRIALEYLVPVQQDLDGPQLETDRVFTLGYQVAL